MKKITDSVFGSFLSTLAMTTRIPLKPKNYSFDAADTVKTANTSYTRNTSSTVNTSGIATTAKNEKAHSDTIIREKNIYGIHAEHAANRKDAGTRDDFSLFPYFFPLIGVLLSLLLGFGVYAMLMLKLKPLIIVLIVLVIQYMTSNIFHFDGFLDVCDAMISYKDKEQRLKIMQDPHHGSFALFFGVIYIAAKAVLLYVLIAGMYAVLAPKVNATILQFFGAFGGKVGKGSKLPLLVFMLYPLIGRMSSVVLGSLLSPCKTTGLAAKLGKLSSKDAALSTGLFMLAVYVVYQSMSQNVKGVMTGSMLLLIIISSIILAAGIVYYPFKRNLNGLTGDAHGCTVELGELFYLLLFYAVV